MEIIKNKITVVGPLAALLTGCAGFGESRDAPLARLLERFPNDRPSCVRWEKATREKGGQLYFIGTALQGGEYSLTLAQAEAEAGALVARRVGEELSHKLLSNVSGANRVGQEAGRFIQRMVEEQTRTFRVSRVEVRGRYCERWVESSGAGEGGRQYFNCYAQMGVFLAEIAAARKLLAQKAAAAVINPQDETARIAAEAFSAELGAAGARE